jgi:hypothetical protein
LDFGDEFDEGGEPEHTQATWGLRGQGVERGPRTDSRVHVLSDYQTMSIPFAEGHLNRPWKKSIHDNKINNSQYGRKPETT